MTLKTVAQADKTLCPLSFGRENPPPGSCIGPLCMAWRWAETAQPFETNKEDRRGYCGNFGHPRYDQ